MRSTNPVCERLAVETYETHQIISRAPGRWVIRRADGHGWHWTEIVRLRHEGLLVHGDGEVALFLGGGLDVTDLGHLGWVESAGLDYLASKLIRGMGWHGAAWDVDRDVAIADVEAELGTAAGAADCRERLTDAIAELRHGHGVEEVRRTLIEGEEGEAETWYRLGEQPSARLVYARAAVARLFALLKAEQAAATPPAEAP